MDRRDSANPLSRWVCDLVAFLVSKPYGYGTPSKIYHRPLLGGHSVRNIMTDLKKRRPYNELNEIWEWIKNGEVDDPRSNC